MLHTARLGCGKETSRHQQYGHPPRCHRDTPTLRTRPPALQIDGGASGGLGGGLVDSLNVSVATGILLHRLLTAQQAAAAGGLGSTGPALLHPEAA